MRALISRIKRRDLMHTVPKASLGVLPMIVSFELGLALFAGYFVARFMAGKETNEPGRFPSLTFTFRNWRVHLHHWLVFLGIFVAAGTAHFFIFAPFAFYGFLGGVIAQGILHYDDWPRIVSRNRM